MMKRVIAFEDFLVPYMGCALAKTLRNVFVNFNLENKIMSITLDNASNNTSAIGKLKLKYEPPMEGRFYHSRCVAHIINLCVQDGLAVPTINNIKESFKTMLKDVFRSGGKNHQRYVRICKQAGKPCLSPHWDVPTRWNSTYHMFLSGLKQRSTLMYFHDLLASKGRCVHFPAENWVTIESLTQLLEVFNNATKILSGVYYPTSPLVLQQIFFMTTKLSEYELEGGIFATMVKPMKEKLKKYFERMPPIITCAAALNPCFNVHGVEFLIESISTDLEFFDDSYATKAKKWFTDSLEGLYNIYYTKYGNPTTTKSSSWGGGSSSKASGRNQMTRLLYRLKEHKNKKARSDPSLSSEYE
ncbi:zinc finger BED domain-containing protein RICESLEEPER 2-like protein [Tanacetum coccineum]